MAGKKKPQLSDAGWDFGDEPRVVQAGSTITFAQTEIKLTDLDALKPFKPLKIEKKGRVLTVHFKTKAQAAKCYNALNGGFVKDSAGDPWIWKAGTAYLSCDEMLDP